MEHESTIIQPPAYVTNINWAWGNFGPPRGRDAERCSAKVINGQQRGNLSAHDCVVKCIDEWRRSRSIERSIAWLIDGSHCHDGPAQDDYRRNSGRAIEYAVKTYGPSVKFMEDEKITNKDFSTEEMSESKERSM